ncbi:MAG: GatB/YqeY domain-containing protein [Aquihabitans sp.]
MLAEQIQNDLTVAMKSRNKLEVSVLRMALAAIKEARVSGTEAHDLTDDEVEALLAREAKRREEAATAFDEGGRVESAAKERAEHAILARYLPTPLSDDELASIVNEVLDAEGFTEPTQMGQAMKAATSAVAGRRDGKAVSALVKARLAGG